MVDENATIQRWKCKECGVHLYGRIEKQHPFRGLDFVHGELALGQSGGSEGEGENEVGGPGEGKVEFAAFVSSIIEGGFEPHAHTNGDEGKGGNIKQVRDRLREIFGEKVYDCLSPSLMDVIAEWEGRRNGKLKAEL